MSIVGYLILAGALVWLWRRTAALEARLNRLEGAHAPDPAEATVPIAEHVAAEEPIAPFAEMPAVPQRSWRPGFDLEDLFGRLLPIWTGGVALAVAGFFLVRWSIDAGLLTPGVRVVLAGLFGAALLGAAEIAYRWRERVADPRVAQALAGAGLATLYAAFYLAGAAYGLIGSTLAFIGLASVTAAAIALSSRFGLPSAVLGLVGGFAAPALVGGEDANLPLLTIYLALVTGGLAVSGRRQERGWIGIAALAAGLGWGALLLAEMPQRPADVALLGGFIVLLGTAIPALFSGEAAVHRMLRIGAAGIAALQLGVLVQSGGFGPLEWGLYLLLGAALAWYGWREPAMREGGALAAAVTVVLLCLWPDPTPLRFAIVALACAALFAGAPLAHIVRRGADRLALGQVAGFALGLAGALYVQFAEFAPDDPAPGIALALLALAALPAIAARLARTSSDASLPLAQAVAALLAYGALAQVVPLDALAWAAGFGAAAVALAAPRLRGALWLLAGATAAWAVPPLSDWLEAVGSSALGRVATPATLPGGRAIALFVLPAIAACGAWRLRAAPAVMVRRALDLALAGLVVVAAHSAFRHGFAVLAGTDFRATGVLQRAAWEALLAGGAWLCLVRGWRAGAIALAGAAVAHFVWFALGLHDPLWADQDVGATPLANALVPAYGAGIAALLLVRRLLPPDVPHYRTATDAAIMAAVTLFALAELRQAFAGSLLTAVPMTPGEDLLRSLLGIVLALAFLLWGARTGLRSWRIGSLVLMVVAVLKVFLVDTAGLGGLARIASFMALGFSLIGIGWFYSRQLRGASKGVETTVT